jgi:hypothetical protein
MADMKALRSEVTSLCAGLFPAIGIPFERTSELQRQLLASFGFGIAFTVGRFNKLSPPEVHALAVCMLMDVFRYSAEQAGAFSRELIESASGQGDPTINAVIHRGIDGHRQLQAGQLHELRNNIESIFQAVGA